MEELTNVSIIGVYGDNITEKQLEQILKYGILTWRAAALLQSPRLSEAVRGKHKKTGKERKRLDSFAIYIGFLNIILYRHYYKGYTSIAEMVAFFCFKIFTIIFGPQEFY